MRIGLSVLEAARSAPDQSMPAVMTGGVLETARCGAALSLAISRQRQERTVSAAGALVERVRLAAMRWLILLKVLCCDQAAIALAASRAARLAGAFLNSDICRGCARMPLRSWTRPALNFVPEFRRGMPYICRTPRGWHRVLALTY
jgi:hypothetical protein